MPTAEEYKQTLLLAVPLDEASAKVRTGPPKHDDDDIELPIWAGVLPLRTGPGEPIRAPTSCRDSTSLPPSPGTADPAGSELTRRRGPRLRDSFRAMPRTVWVLFAGTFVLDSGASSSRSSRCTSRRTVSR